MSETAPLLWLEFNDALTVAAFVILVSVFTAILVERVSRSIGDKLAREIKGLRPDLPVILISGFNEALNRNYKLKGVARSLMKPFEKSALAQVVREVLDERMGKRRPLVDGS